MDTYKNLLFWGLTAGVGYAASAYVSNGDERKETVVVVWALVFTIAAVIYAALSVHERWSKRDCELLSRMDKYDESINRLIDAQQQSMRASLVHYAEKYLERGWLTPEELKGWTDMYNSYDTLGLNGYMHGYLVRLEKLNLKSIDTIGAEVND